MNGQRSVLIVDRSEETREVLQTALQRRGVQTFTAGRVQRGLELARRHHPDLIVLDLEVDAASAEHLVPLAEQSRADHASLVILGKVARSQRPLAGEIVAKPYHYAPLLRKIEELLDAAPELAPTHGG